MKIVNRQGMPQVNNVMDTMSVYEFTLVYLVCRLISYVYYKKLTTAARV